MQPASQHNVYGAEQSRPGWMQCSGMDTESWNAAWSRWAPWTFKVRRKGLTEDFWEVSFLPFFGRGGFVLPWFCVRFSFFVYLLSPQGNWTQTKMQTWECVWRVKKEQIKNGLLPQVETVLVPWGIWKKKCKQKAQLCKALELKQACSSSLMPQVSENQFKFLVQ